MLFYTVPIAVYKCVMRINLKEEEFILNKVKRNYFIMAEKECSKERSSRSHYIITEQMKR